MENKMLPTLEELDEMLETKASVNFDSLSGTFSIPDTLIPP